MVGAPCYQEIGAGGGPNLIGAPKFYDSMVVADVQHVERNRVIDVGSLAMKPQGVLTNTVNATNVVSKVTSKGHA